MGTEARARLALSGLLLLTLLAFGQVFGDGEYPGPSIVGIIAATGIAIGASHLRLRPPIGLAVSAAALGWYVIVIFQGGRTWYGLPTWSALEGLGRSLARAYLHSQVDYAPVPVRPGYVVFVVIGMWAAAAIGEVATFRWRRPLVAVAIPVTMFALTLIVGTRAAAPLLVPLFLTALLVYLRQESVHGLLAWAGRAAARGGPPGTSATARLARRMGMASVAAAIAAPVLLSPSLEGFIAWKNDTPGAGGSGDSGIIDPLVSIAPRLIEQSDEVLFEVEAAEATYWRLTSLARFDGSNWTPETRQEAALGIATLSPPPLEAAIPLAQSYEVVGLRGETLPAAGHPQVIHVTNALVGRDDDSLRWVAEAYEARLENGLLNGMRYEVLSMVPSPSYRRLRTAEVGDPGEVYTAMPEDTSEAVRAIAREWTAEGTTAFEDLIAIQNRLRVFSYSLKVEPEDSSDYLAQFLTETREGYCQQFATAFAALARLSGYPTRVAVGFLPGAQSVVGNRFTVRGTDAHAWPEVYFADFGWVPFEPTPRSLAPPPDYTTPPIRTTEFRGFQDGYGDFGGLRPDQLGESITQRNSDRRRLAEREGTFAAAERERRGRRGPAQWTIAFARMIRTVILLLAVGLSAIPAIKWWKRRRRTSVAKRPRELLIAAFSDIADAATDLALPRASSESATRYLTRVALTNRVAIDEATRLATLVERAEFAPTDATSADAIEGSRLAGSLRAALWASASWRERASLVWSTRSLASGIRGMPRPRVRFATGLIGRS